MLCCEEILSLVYIFFPNVLGVVMYDDEFGTKLNKIQTTTFTYPFYLFMVNTEV